MKRKSRSVLVNATVPTPAHATCRMKSRRERRRIWRSSSLERVGRISLFLDGELRRRDDEMDNGTHTVAPVSQLRGGGGSERCGCPVRVGDVAVRIAVANVVIGNPTVDLIFHGLRHL